eukprot:SAG25_NODE_1771_length_2362_cov_1.452497_1_plen_153_part_10
MYALRAVFGRQPAQQRDLAAVRAWLHPHRQLRVQEVPAVEVALVAVHRAHLRGQGGAQDWGRLLELWPPRLASRRVCVVCAQPSPPQNTQQRAVRSRRSRGADGAYPAEVALGVVLLSRDLNDLAGARGCGAGQLHVVGAVARGRTAQQRRPH